MLDNHVCGLYIRISREEREEHRHSIQTQKKILDQFCYDNGLQIYDYYIDEGVSGTILERPKFNKLLDDIKCKRINVVIVKDLSRLGRNHLGVGSLLEKEFIGKVRFISVSEHLDTAYGYDETIPIRNFVNEYYSRDLSKKVKSGLKSKAFKTRISSIQGGFYGYKYKDGTHELIVDENVKPIILMIYSMHLAGKKTKEIVEEINKLDVPTPGYLRYLYYGDKSAYRDGVGNKYIWNSEMVRNILNKYEYTGNTIQYKTTVINKKVVQVPKELQIHLENTHPAIITNKMFNEAQSLLKHSVVKKRDEEVINNTFQGLIYNEDGYKMTYVCSKGKYEYRARLGRRYGIPADDVEEIVLEEFKSMINSLLNDEEKLYNTLINVKGLNNNEIRIKELKSRYKTLNLEGSNLFNLKLYKQISVEEYKEKMFNVSLELEKVEIELKELENIQVNARNFKVSFTQFKELVLNKVSNNLIHFAKEVIERIVVHKSSVNEYRVQIFYKYIG